MSQKNIKRIVRDLKKLEDEKYEDIIVEVNESDICDLKFLFIGPKDTPFEGGFFYFSMDLSAFPFDCPKVKFLTPYEPTFRLHPNLYANGKCCLSILGTWGTKDWSPQLTIEKIILTIQALLDNNPLSNEPAYYNIKINDIKARVYNTHSRYLTLKSIPVMLNRKDLPIPFTEFITKFIKDNPEIYVKSICKLVKEGENIEKKTIHHVPHNDLFIKKIKDDIYKILESI